MNPTVILFVVLFCGIEISFVQSVSVNLIIIAFGVLVLLLHRVPIKTYLRLLLFTLIPALGIWISIFYFSLKHDLYFATVMFTRIYAYALLGAIVNYTSSTEDLINSLEQNAHIPSKFIYGMLAAANFVTQVRTQIKIIRVSAQMRGVTLHFWSPQLLFKGIYKAFEWSENLAEAMTSHGFVEDAPRSHFNKIVVSRKDLLGAFIILACLQIVVFIPFL